MIYDVLMKINNTLTKLKKEDFEIWKSEFNPKIEIGEFENLFEKIERDEKFGTAYTFWYVDNGDKIGFLQVFGVMRHPFQSGYIEISILEKYRKKGYGKKAIKALEDFSFNQLGIKKLVAPIAPENVASIALFNSLGFEKVHTDPYAFFFGGKAVAHEIYVKLSQS